MDISRSYATQCLVLFIHPLKPSIWSRQWECLNMFTHCCRSVDHCNHQHHTHTLRKPTIIQPQCIHQTTVWNSKYMYIQISKIYLIMMFWKWGIYKCIHGPFYGLMVMCIDQSQFSWSCRRVHPGWTFSWHTLHQESTPLLSTAASGSW